jgi:hypothetical protein
VAVSHLTKHDTIKQEGVPIVATTQDVDPKKLTIYGRLSFPTFTAQQAFDLSQKGSYPVKSVADAKPSFQLILEQPQYDKAMAHIESVFLPYCIEQEKAGEKRDSLSAKEVKQILDGLHGDLADQTFNTPVKEVHEKTLELMPEGVATFKCIGNAGVDTDLQAIVRNEDQLAVPDPDRVKYPCILPVNETVFEFYPGALVTATVNLYAYHNGKLPGFSAGASVAVFKEDADRFGGGVSVDEDEMFLDD